MAIDSASSLLFKIGANSDDAQENIARFRQLFSTSISDLKTQFHDFASEITGGGDAINVSWTAVGGIVAGAAVAAGAAIFEMANKASEAGEEMLHLSEQTGISTRMLGGLKLGAQMAGIDFNQLSMAFAHLATNISPFTQASAQGKMALAGLGVKITDVHGQMLPMDQILGQIADKFHAIPDGTEKASLAASLFGSRIGMQLIPLLDEGSKGMANLTAKAKELGISFSQEGAEKAEQYQDQMKLLKDAWSGFTLQLGEKAIPIVEEAGKTIAVVVEVASDFVKWIVNATPVVKILMAVVAGYTARMVLANTATLAATAATGAWAAVTEGIPALLAAVQAALAGVVTWESAATLGVSALILALVEMIQHWQTVKGVLENLPAVGAILRAIGDAASFAWREIEKAWDWLARFLHLSVAVNDVKRRIDGVNKSLGDMAALGGDATSKLQGLGPSMSALGTGSQVAAVDKLAAAYQSVTASIQQMQEQMAKPDVAAYDAYNRGVEAAKKALQADKQHITSKKLTDKTLEQVQQEYNDVTIALWQKLQLQLGQIDDAATAKAQKAAAAREKTLETEHAREVASANAFARAQQHTWNTITAGILKSATKIDATFDQQQARVDQAASKLQQMAQQSTNVTLTAGERIRAEYQKQIAAINNLVAAQKKKGISEEQSAQLARASAAAQHAALMQETTDLAKLRQQQMMTEMQSVNSFLHMGIAAAGYRSAVVSALMDVIKTLEKELVAHIATAAGSAAAENLKNVAVGKGVGLRSVWHAAEQLALGLADLASFNFGGAAQHFAASASFTAVAASVGSAVASLFAGGAGGSGRGGHAAAAHSTTHSAGHKSTNAAGSGATTTINVHLDGIGTISQTSIQQVMDAINGTVQKGQGTMTASHLIIGGATVAAG